jgi:hypothetical protein
MTYAEQSSWREIQAFLPPSYRRRRPSPSRSGGSRPVGGIGSTSTPIATPALAETFLARVTRVPVRRVLLDNACHYPIEQPGLDQMVEAIGTFCDELTRGAAASAAEVG